MICSFKTRWFVRFSIDEEFDQVDTGGAQPASCLGQDHVAVPGVRCATVLGIAQYDQGKYAEAKANFEKVTGPRQAVARLWLALIGTKG